LKSNLCHDFFFFNKNVVGGGGWVNFREKVHVPSSKTYVTFQGSGRHNTIITWDDNANKTGSTFTSASVAVLADHFIAQDISFEV